MEKVKGSFHGWGKFEFHLSRFFGMRIHEGFFEKLLEIFYFLHFWEEHHTLQKGKEH